VIGFRLVVWRFENPRMVVREIDSRNRERDFSTLVNLHNGYIAQSLLKRFRKRVISGTKIIRTPEVVSDQGYPESAGQLAWKDSATVIPIQVHNTRQRNLCCERARYNCASARSGDQIERGADVERGKTALLGEISRETRQIGRGVRSPHSAAV
jgi:hypothetical protein